MPRLLSSRTRNNLNPPPCISPVGAGIVPASLARGMTSRLAFLLLLLGSFAARASVLPGFAVKFLGAPRGFLDALLLARRRR